jgi:hypothetical protein
MPLTIQHLICNVRVTVRTKARSLWGEQRTLRAPTLEFQEAAPTLEAGPEATVGLIEESAVPEEGRNVVPEVNEDLLTERVWRMLRDDLFVQRERSGAGRDWGGRR